MNLKSYRVYWVLFLQSIALLGTSIGMIFMAVVGLVSLLK